MKIAVLSDIHGNIIALEAVLREMNGLNVERIFVLGDVVGYYYHPDEVLRLLEHFKTTYIRGNHERMLKEAREHQEAGRKIEEKYGHGISAALKLLSHEDLDMLTELPDTATILQDGVRFFLCHGSPWSNDEYVYPDAPPAVLEKCAAIDVDFVLMGHTHYPFVRRGSGATVLNPGSVGQPRDHGNMASWAIVDTANKDIVFKRTVFDIVSLIEEAQKIDPSVPYLREVLQRNI